MTLPLPARVDAQSGARLETLAPAVLRHAEAVDHYLAIQPTMEIVQVEINSADLPVSVLVQTDRVVGVLRLSSVLVTDESAASASSDTSITWEHNPGSDESGVVVRALGGLTAGLVYRVTMLVIGRRS